MSRKNPECKRDHVRMEKEIHFLKLEKDRLESRLTLADVRVSLIAAMAGNPNAAEACYLICLECRKLLEKLREGK